jgi:hypothetical protein
VLSVLGKIVFEKFAQSMAPGVILNNSLNIVSILTRDLDTASALLAVDPSCKGVYDMEIPRLLHI